MVYVNLRNDKNISLINFNHHNRRVAIVATLCERHTRSYTHAHTHTLAPPAWHSTRSGYIAAAQLVVVVIVIAAAAAA